MEKKSESDKEVTRCYLLIENILIRDGIFNVFPYEDYDVSDDKYIYGILINKTDNDKIINRNIQIPLSSQDYRDKVMDWLLNKIESDGDEIDRFEYLQ